ncbi:MAG: deoxyribodipyrimidine photolyase [Planctomycetaceae bacterium]|nr:deoxyribodipyrimidine photolyase [Planctomycetaceae bacterium]
MPDSSASIVWFRRDLRVADQPALVAALARGKPVIPVFIWSPGEEGRWPEGAASRWWLHFSLLALDARLQSLGSRLIVRQGASLSELRKLVEETGALAIFWNRRYEPDAIRRETEVKAALKADGLLAESYNGSLLYEPWEIKSKSGGPYKVFTPFSKACLVHAEPERPLATPTRVAAPAAWPKSLPIEGLGFLPTIKWDSGFHTMWHPGCDAAEQMLKTFLPAGVAQYVEERNRPDHAGTSRLSPALHFGEISPRQVWHTVCDHLQEKPRSPQMGEPFLRQLLWREFAHHLLFHFPQTPTEPLREEFSHFPWLDNQQHLRAWQRGLTGYPIVDAGMRELWATGWMHNRVRMIVASFLVKDLLLPWQAGADWFWNTLVDADLANNTLGWQWTAGCGADAAPYFRIFNPVSQGENFDPERAYVRRWIPELAELPNEWIHQPWNAPPLVLREAGIKLGKTYPRPIVDHGNARLKALEALSQIRQS